MAKAKTVKKTRPLKKVATSTKKKSAKKKSSGRKSATKPLARKAAVDKQRSRRKVSATPHGSRRKMRRTAKEKTARPRKGASKTNRSHKSRSLGPHEYLEKISLTIHIPDPAGDLIVTEDLGGVAQVHHTVHAGSETTAIPGKSYRDLKKLGEGTHQIDVIRSLAPPTAPQRPSAAP